MAQPVYLRDIWPTPTRGARHGARVDRPRDVPHEYAKAFEGDKPTGSIMPVPTGDIYQWDDSPPTSRSRRISTTWWIPKRPSQGYAGMRVLALLGDSVTTDHISPAGSIPKDSPAGKYLIEQGVQPKDFNSYGARRGNHEVMVRGTLANVRLRNQLAPGTEGGWTRICRMASRCSFTMRRCVSAGRRAAGDYRGQGIRLGLVARLGGEGRAAAGREAR
jgi:aconitate hydratase